jgi:hypothetical protein
MFSFNSKPNPKSGASVEPTRPMPMTVEERMAFRREMMFQTIRQCMKSMEVNSSMYRFKVMNLDSRHHRFLAMIEVTSTFEAKIEGVLQAFSQIEAYIQRSVFERFDLILDGIFWRVRESEKAFERKSREGDLASNAPTSAILTPSRQGAGNQAANAVERLARHPMTAASPEELKAFREALAQGGYVPGVQLEGKAYHTQPTPLGDKPATGGTQYGSPD